MSRVGQCPSCRTTYELEDEHLGRALDCECGATLFAADVAGFNEIPVYCDQCDGEYVVDREGAGEVVECECGSQITVPNVVFRMPVASRGKSAGAAIEEADKQLDSKTPTAAPQLKKGERLVNCPDCKSEFVVTRDDLNVDAECSCGCIFVVVVNSQKQVVAEKAKPKPVAAAPKPKTKPKKPAGSDENDESESYNRGEKKKSLVNLVGLAAVALFVLFAVGFFIAQKSGLLAKSDTEAEAAEKPPVPDLTPIETIEPIEAGGDANANGAASGDPSSTSEIPSPTIRRSSPESSGTDNAPKAPALFSAPPKKELPKPAAARAIVPIVAAKKSGKTFPKLLEDVFIEYEKSKELEEEAGASGDNAAYHEQLGKTIGFLQQTMQVGGSLKKPPPMEQLRFMLAYSYFKAGHIAEAAIMGEQVARYGKPKDPQTKQGAMIALAATQEANATQWGVPQEVGELDFMRTVIQLIGKRWPEDPQLDLYRMNLAQLYDRYSFPVKAASVYANVGSDSPHFTTAQLAAGSALWGEFRTRASAAEISPQDITANERIRDKAKQFFITGVDKSIQKDASPKRELLVAKLSIARMALHAGDLDDAETWLTKTPMSLTQSITVDEPTEEKVKVSPEFVRIVFETLFSIRRQLNNPSGSKEALTEMAAILGPENSDQLGQLFLGVATSYIGQLSRSPKITRKQFSELSDLIEPLKGQGGVLTASNMLWLGESWASLGPKAANESLQKQCFQKAADAYEMAMARDDFPASNLQGAQLRRAQMLRQAGDLEAAVVLIGKILADSPNAIGLQIEAAEALQQSAIGKENPLSLTDVVAGPADSPIWGWNKLVTTLHAVHYSANATDKNSQRLFKAQYNLAKCKWLIANATANAAQKAKLMGDLRKLVSRVANSIPPGTVPWSTKLNELITEINAAK